MNDKPINLGGCEIVEKQEGQEFVLTINVMNVRPTGYAWQPETGSDLDLENYIRADLRQALLALGLQMLGLSANRVMG